MLLPLKVIMVTLRGRILPLKMTTWSLWEVEFYLSKWPHWHYSYKMFVGSQSKTATLIELKLFWKWSHDLWEWPYGGPVNFCRWKDCPTSQIDHIDFVYLQQGYKMFLGSQSRTATLIELKFFGSDHMTSESDHGLPVKNGYVDWAETFWKWSHDLWEWPYGGPIKFGR